MSVPSGIAGSTRSRKLGFTPETPLPYGGWGWIPDQYGRRWDGDDGDDSSLPVDPGLTDLPALRSGWGPRARPAGR